MEKYEKGLDGDTFDAFRIAAQEIAKEKGMDEETVMKTMKKLIYLFVTRI